MANKKHVALVKQWSSTWNEWRRANPEVTPNLKRADLMREHLSEADLHESNLFGVDLSEADLAVPLMLH